MPASTATFHACRISAEPPDGWAELVADARESTYFHRAEWTATYAAHHGGHPIYLSIERDGRLLGALPAVRFRRGVFHLYESLPLGTYGGPIARAGASHADVVRALLRRFIDLRRHPLCVRVQCAMRRPIDDPGEMAGLTHAPLHLIPLAPTFETFWMEVFPGNRRNECRRAMKRGATIDTDATHEDIEAYYPLDVAAHRQWGLRPHPEAFFHALVELESPFVHVFVARAEGRLIGLHVCFESGEELVVWHGVTDRTVSKRYFPTSLLARAEAELGCARGLAALNMGSSGGAGIANYKKLLGGEITETPRYEWNHRLLPLLRRLRPND